MSDRTQRAAERLLARLAPSYAPRIVRLDAVERERQRRVAGAEGWCDGCPDREACAQGGCHLDGGPVKPDASAWVPPYVAAPLDPEPARTVHLPVRRVVAITRYVALALGAVVVVALVATGDQPRAVPLTPIPAPAATTWTTTTVTVPPITAPEETV